MQNTEKDPVLEAKSFPKPPGSDVTAALSSAAVYAASLALFAAVASKIPILNRLYNRGMQKEAGEAALVGGFLGAIIGFCDNHIRRNEIYPMKVENHMLKESLRKTNEAINGGQVNHAEKILADREEKQPQHCTPSR